MYRFSTYVYNTGRFHWCCRKVKEPTNDYMVSGLLKDNNIVAYCESKERFAELMGIKVEDISDCGEDPA
jgi:hypothetical protein